MRVGDWVTADEYTGRIEEIAGSPEGLQYLVNGMWHDKVTLVRSGNSSDKYEANPALPIALSLKDPKCMPEKHGDWIDLKAQQTRRYSAGDSFVMPLGVAMKLPDGYEAQLVPRSSTFKKYGVIQTNGVGIIDNSYAGIDDIWGMPLYALKDGVINAYDRIAQFRIVPVMGNVTFTDGPMGDNRGGFGSTGR